MLPALAWVRPSSMRIIVVLPAPLGPRKPKALPRGTLQIDAVDRGTLAEALGQRRSSGSPDQPSLDERCDPSWLAGIGLLVSAIGAGRKASDTGTRGVALFQPNISPHEINRRAPRRSLACHRHPCDLRFLACNSLTRSSSWAVTVGVAQRRDVARARDPRRCRAAAGA